MKNIQTKSKPEIKSELKQTLLYLAAQYEEISKPYKDEFYLEILNVLSKDFFDENKVKDTKLKQKIKKYVEFYKNNSNLKNKKLIPEDEEIKKHLAKIILKIY